MRVSAATILAVAPSALALTAQQLLAAPRRSDPSPNPSGEWAALSETSYDWEAHEASTSWKLMNVGSGEITNLTDSSDINELFWIGPQDTSIVYINGTNPDVPGGVTIYLTDATSFEDATLIGALDAPYTGFKGRKLENGDIAFVMYTMAYKNGTAYNPELVSEPLSTARIYTDTFVRHWDTWLTPERYAAFSGTLKSAGSGYPTNSSNTPYTFNGNMTNLLQDIEAPVTRPENPWQPFGDSGDFDISPDGSTVAFLSKATDLSKQNHTASYIWLVPFDGSSPAEPINHPDKNPPNNAQGASAAPRWSWDGQKLAYVQMADPIYESDKNVLYVAEFGSDGYTTSPEIKALASDWDRSPDIVNWARDSESIYVGAPDNASEKIYNIPLDSGDDFKPENITEHRHGSVTGFSVLEDGTLLVSDNSIVNSRGIYTVKDGEKNDLFIARDVDAELEGIKETDWDDLWFDGNATKVHAFIVYPTDFDASKKYPLAFMIHGGPQVAWTNSWSTRWNPRTWVDQGYVAVLPNPTGSNSFGQEFQDRIQNNWGSYPYDDLVKCFEYLQTDEFPFIDTENAIAAGASYGGFMTNWIQGHDLGREFKALVTHDGSTSTLNQYASEELWFMQHDFNGTLWENRENYEKWDPISFASEFATPHLVIHNTLDYRLPESEGIMLFNVLVERGVPSRFLSFPDENHWVLNRENSLVWHTEIYNWINHYTGTENEQAIDTEQYVGSG